MKLPRRIVAAFLMIMLLLLLVIQPATAQSEVQTVKVGYFLHDGYQNKSADGVYSGYGYEYLQKIAEYVDVRFEYVEGTWAECLQWIQDGKIDLLGFMLKTDEREALYDYSNLDCGYNTTKLLTRKSNSTLAENDWANFNGIHVGLNKGSAIIEQFAQYASEHGFTYEQTLYASQEDVTAALQNGEVDAICVSNVVIPDWARTLSVFNPQPIYYVVKKGNTELLSNLNYALGQIKMSAPTFEQSLRDTYYVENASNTIVFSDKERQYLANAGTITVAIDPNYMPIEGFSDEGEQPQGFTPTLLSKISELSGLQFAYQSYDTYSAAMSSFGSGDYEILSTANQSVSNMADAMLSNVYFRASMVLVGNKDFSFAGKDDIRIALTPKNMFLMGYLQNLYPQCQLIQCESFDEAARMVSSGEADLLARNVYSAQSESLSDYPNLRIVYDTGRFSDYRFAFPASTPKELVSVINKCLGAIPESEVNAMLTSAMLGNVPVEQNAGKVLAITLLSLALSALAVFFVIKLRKFRKTLMAQAYFDPLTGSRNLSRFKLDAQAIISQNAKQGYVIDFMDVRNFQLVNELYGFDAGDKLLCLITDHLCTVLDEKKEAFGRIGDDEFVVLLAADNAETLFVRAEASFARLLASSKMLMAQNVVFVRGYYFLDGETDLNAALEKAMLAHKQAKLRGESIVVYDEAMKQAVLRDQHLEDRMESALEHGEFRLFMQPQYRVCDETVSGVEALVRWVEEDGTIIFPDDFIPLFERNGFVLKLDYYMFEQACKTIRGWIDSGVRPVVVSVNFARTHVLDPNWISDLIEIADKYAVPKTLLEIEITERTAVEREDVLIELIGQMHQAGFRVSIDDFGSGHSSLGILQSLQVDTLKLDRSFFQAETDTQRTQAIVGLIIQMAKVLRMSTMAEGIEQKEQVQFLKKLDCDTIQGYYYAKPMPVDEITPLLRP